MEEGQWDWSMDQGSLLPETSLPLTFLILGLQKALSPSFTEFTLSSFSGQGGLQGLPVASWESEAIRERKVVSRPQAVR